MILWQILVRSEKLESAFLCIDACLSYRFLDHFQLCASRRHILWTFYSQIAQISIHWCRKKYLRILKHNDAIKIMMWFAFSFVIAEFKQKIFASWCNVYSISNINLRIDASSHEDSKHDRNFSDARSHVLQFDFTSYLKSINYRISIRSFLQFSHRCII